ncbi:MAG: hypothetical protein Q9165_002154 [Trypethelium subeluteriae]
MNLQISRSSLNSSKHDNNDERGQGQAPNPVPVLEWRRGVRENRVIATPQSSKYVPAEDYDAIRGRILWLPKFARIEASAKRRNETPSKDICDMHYGKKNEDGFNHPVVILSRCGEHEVKCHLMTSFAGTTLQEKHRNASIRKMYVPIAPSANHPDSTPHSKIPTLKLCWGLRAASTNGHVVVREPITMDWRDLEIWEDGDRTLFFASFVRFDPHDMDQLDERTRRLAEEKLGLRSSRGSCRELSYRSLMDHQWRFKSAYQPHTQTEYREPSAVPRTCAAMCSQVRERRKTSRPEEGICPLSGHTFCECARLSGRAGQRRYSVDQLKTMVGYEHHRAEDLKYELAEKLELFKKKATKPNHEEPRGTPLPSIPPQHDLVPPPQPFDKSRGRDGTVHGMCDWRSPAPGAPQRRSSPLDANWRASLRA